VTKNVLERFRPWRRERSVVSMTTMVARAGRHRKGEGIKDLRVQRIEFRLGGGSLLGAGGGIFSFNSPHPMAARTNRRPPGQREEKYRRSSVKSRHELHGDQEERSANGNSASGLWNTFFGAVPTSPRSTSAEPKD